MEITLNKTDELNGIIEMKIAESDYAEKVDKSMRELRRTVNMNGFRKGNAPMGLVKKMYGTAVFVDELNKLVSDSLMAYINENKLDILGEPMPSETNEKMELSDKKSFEFKFDVAFRPAINIAFDKSDKVTLYEIKVDEEEINMHKKYYLKRYGKYVEADISDDTSIFSVDVNGCDENGNIIEGTLSLQDIHAPFYRFSATAQEKIKILKVGDSFFMKSEEVSTQERDLLYMLNLTEKDKGKLPVWMHFSLKLIKNLLPAEVNAEFFEAAFGKDTVKTEDEFTQKIVEDIQKSNHEMTGQRLKSEARKWVLNKTGLKLPDEFLKRWILQQDKNKSKTREEIDKEYPLFVEDLKWHLISQQIIRSNNLEAGNEDYTEAARKQARLFYAQYGMPDIGDEHLTDIVDKILKDEKQKDKLTELILDDKVFEFLKENLNIETKKVNFEEYKKLNQNNDEKPE